MNTKKEIESVFKFSNYKDFLRQALPVLGPLRGARTKLAEVLGCQAGFISLVLSGAGDFSLEHGIRIARFLALSEDESDFFLLLIDHDRAGSIELKRHFKRKIDEVLKKRSEILGRLKVVDTMTESDQLLYYSSWIFTAVHMALMVPELQEKKAIAKFLQLPVSRVAEILQFFIRTGLAVENEGHIVGGPTRMHIPSTSPLVFKHHSNWRMRAIHSMDQNRSQDLHYSLVMSLSEEAVEKIKAMLLDCVQKVEPILKAATDETVYALNLDLFSVGNH